MLEEAYLLTLVGLFVPLTLGLYMRTRGEWPAMAAMLSGTGLWLWQFLGDLAKDQGESWAGRIFTPEDWLACGEVKVPISLTAPVVALLVYLAVHFLRPPRAVESKT